MYRKLLLFWFVRTWCILAYILHSVLGKVGVTREELEVVGCSH